MYRKLLPYINKFVMIRQGMLSQIYVGRILDVDQEALELQTFQQDGTKAACWTISLSTITEFLTESRQLDTLALKVKWANSKEEDEAGPDHITEVGLSGEQGASKPF